MWVLDEFRVTKTLNWSISMLTWQLTFTLFWLTAKGKHNSLRPIVTLRVNTPPSIKAITANQPTSSTHEPHIQSKCSPPRSPSSFSLPLSSWQSLSPRNPLRIWRSPPPTLTSPPETHSPSPCARAADSVAPNRTNAAPANAPVSTVFVPVRIVKILWWLVNKKHVDEYPAYFLFTSSECFFDTSDNHCTT